MNNYRYRFRAWNEWTGEMTAPYGGDFIGWPAPGNWLHTYEVLQWTGLKDCDGADIYEGDIVTSPDYPFQDDGEYNYHGVIEWMDGGFVWVFRLVNQEKSGISDGIAQNLDSENAQVMRIIGNIYQNPELLEKPGG